MVSRLGVRWRLKDKDYVRRYQQFRQRLRQARVEAGLTQMQASRLFGRHQAFISKCESGERRVDFVELQYFAKMYKKPLDFFRPSRS
jgi:transcriptional regulator with XRE-family HTH domain